MTKKNIVDKLLEAVQEELDTMDNGRECMPDDYTKVEQEAFMLGFQRGIRIFIKYPLSYVFIDEVRDKYLSVFLEAERIVMDGEERIDRLVDSISLEFSKKLDVSLDKMINTMFE